MKPVLFIKKFIYIIIAILFIQNITYAYPDTVYTIIGTKISNNTLYIYGNKRLQYNIPADGWKDSSKTFAGYIKEYDLTTLQMNNFILLPQVEITKLSLDKDGNKYTSGKVISRTFNYDYFETDDIKFIEGAYVISKISQDNSINYYNILIPACYFNYSQIEFNRNNELIFMSETTNDWFERDTNGELRKFLTNDTMFYISKNAFQKNRNLYSDYAYGSDLYIAKLSSNGKNIELATFLGSRGFELPIKLAIGKYNEILTITNSDFGKLNTIDPEHGTLFGMYPTTPNSFEPKLPEKDSLLPETQAYSTYTYINPYNIGILDSNMENLLYGSYYTYGIITDAGFDQDNRVVITGWNRENDRGLPVGSFIARFNENMSDFSEIKSLSAIDKLDTVYYTDFSDYYNPKLYFAKDDRNIFMNIDSNGDIVLVALTNDPNHPVTADAFQCNKLDSLDFVIYKLDKDFNVKYCSYFGSNGIETIDAYRYGNDSHPIPRPGFSDNSVYIIGSSTDLTFPVSPIVRNRKNFLTKFYYGELGINDEKQNYKFTLYPNPSSDFINIEPELNSSKIEIYNSLGEKVAEYSQVQKLDISNYPSGIYTIKSGNKTKSFVKI